MKLLISFLSFFLLFTINSKAQIYFQNNTSEPVFVALCVYYDGSNSKYWGSEGWWKVEPGDKKEVSSAIGFQDNIYYYAFSSVSNKEYAGNVNILVHPTNAFSIKNADKEYKQKENPEYVFKKFRHVDMNQGAFQLKYTIQLNY